MNMSSVVGNLSVLQTSFSSNSCLYGPIPKEQEKIRQFESFCRCRVYDEGLLETLLVEDIFNKLFLTLSVIGNIFVIAVLYRMRRGFFNAPMKALLQNLSVADMAVCILYNINEAVGRNSPLTTTTYCKLFGGLQWASLSSSSCAVCCVSIERYFALVKPLEFNLTRKKALLMILFSWYYSLLFTIPDFYFLERLFLGPVCLKGIVPICFYAHWQGIAVSTVNMICIIATFVIPLVIVVYTNVSIIVVLVKSAKANKRRSMEQGNVKRTSGVIMIVLLLTLVYVVCSVPYTIHFIFNAIPTGVEMHKNFSYASYYLMQVNSSCNPFIYSFFSAEFRKECVNLISLPCRWIKSKLCTDS